MNGHPGVCAEADTGMEGSAGVPPAGSTGTNPTEAGRWTIRDFTGSGSLVIPVGDEEKDSWGYSERRIRPE